MFSRGNQRNVKRNAREQRLQFMNSQAALIAQKKKEIEEKLALQQKEADPKECEKDTNPPVEEVVQPTIPPIPFKNDGSFLEQFKQLQQQTVKSETVTPPFDRLPQSEYPLPPRPQIDVSVPPPMFLNHPPPQYPHLPPSPVMKTEVKRERRSPSPYSPSRPCEDEDEHTFFNKELHPQPGPSHSSEDIGIDIQRSFPEMKRKFKEESNEEEESVKGKEKERKRQSRWGPQELKVEPKLEPKLELNDGQPLQLPKQTVLARSSFLTRITSADPQILTYAVRVFGTTDLSEDQWKQCMDQVKMQYVYHEMLRKKEERQRLEMAGKVKYEYDSDEETEGGTWEHKRRLAEMEKTKEWADQLTDNGRGKHHLSHFLPPEELAKFMEKFQAVQEGRVVDESDYKEFKIAESNVGYQMLKKFGWSEGEGLGIGGSGITAPVNATRRNEAQGLGAMKPDELTSNDDEYDAYRKRMMLAYRFRPNPLNNPRRAYY